MPSVASAARLPAAAAPLLAAGCLLVAAPLPAAAPAARSPLQVTQQLLVERRVAAPDGTVRVVAEPRAKAQPGDGLIVRLAYRNAGAAPLADLVIADPVPAALAYRAPAEDSPAPEVSVDGRSFAAAPAALAVATPGGGSRPATAADVVAVRWRLDRPLAPGAGATLAFRAVVK